MIIVNMKELIRKMLLLPNPALNKEEWVLLYEIIQELNIDKRESLSLVLEKTNIDPTYQPDILSYMEAWHKSIPLPLPNIPFTTKQIDELADIFHAYYQKRQIDLQNRLGQSRLKSSSLQQIIKFIDIWNDTADFFLDLITLHIFPVWKKVNPNTPCGADYLVPLLIIILPDNINLLRALLEKIILVSEIEQSGETACYLTSLYISVATKIRELENNKAESVPDKKVMLAAKELDRLENISALFCSSNEYMDELLDLFFPLLKIKNKIIYNIYGDNDHSPIGKRKMMDALILAVVHGQVNLQDSELKLYMDKYDALIDLQATLVRLNDNTQQKLQIFAEKFNHHKAMLQKNNDNDAVAFIKTSGSTIGFSRIFNLLRTPTKEEVFVNTADKIIGALGLNQEKMEHKQLQALPVPSI